MFKNWFKSTNAKRMEEQIAELREDVTCLQAQIKELMNKQTLCNVLEPSSLDNVFEPPTLDKPRKEELLAVVVDPASILEKQITHSLESLIMKEPFGLLSTLDNVIEKVLDQVPIVEKVLDQVPIVEKVLDQVPIVEKVLEQVPIVVEKVLDQVPMVEKVLDQVPMVEKVLDQVPTVVEKVLDQVPTVEKEINTVQPKKRRQSKKASQLEEALPKMTV